MDCVAFKSSRHAQEYVARNAAGHSPTSTAVGDFHPEADSIHIPRNEYKRLPKLLYVPLDLLGSGSTTTIPGKRSRPVNKGLTQLGIDYLLRLELVQFSL